jgi:hypothetical protein
VGRISTRAICISSPHRHSGPSVQSGINKRSYEDMRPPATGKANSACMPLVRTTSLTFKRNLVCGFNVKAAEPEKGPDQRGSGFEVCHLEEENHARQPHASSPAPECWGRIDCLALLHKSHSKKNAAEVEPFLATSTDVPPTLTSFPSGASRQLCIGISLRHRADHVIRRQWPTDPLLLELTHWLDLRGVPDLRQQLGDLPEPVDFVRRRPRASKTRR